MKILAFGAHPDDIEIFMFGLLCAYKTNDVNDIILAIATDGSKGGINPGNELARIRRKETFNALQDLGKPTMLNVVDGDLSISPVAEKKITKFIDDASPDLIITHDKNDYHSDHSALSSFVKNAASFKCPVLYCDTYMGVNFTPNIYVDIGDYFKLKKEAIMMHKSQKPDNYFRVAQIMNRFRSAQANNLDGYCEAYRFIPQYPFPDIRELLPRSPKINLHQV